MTCDDFLAPCSGPGSVTDLRKALSEGKTCAWRMRRTTLEYAVQDASHPVFALLATGRRAAPWITGARERAAWSMDARGIEEHLVSIGQRGSGDYAVGDGEVLPRHTGCVRISADSARLRAALEGAFSVPAAAGPVADIRTGTATGTNLEGTRATTPGPGRVPCRGRTWPQRTSCWATRARSRRGARSSARAWWGW